MNKKYTEINKQKGAAMLISVVFFLFISLATIAGLVSPAIRDLRESQVGLASYQAYLLAESGAEDSYYRIKFGYNINPPESIILNSGSASTDTSLAGGEFTIISTGQIGDYERTVTIQATDDDNIYPLSHWFESL